MRIGEVARTAGVSVQTLRFYERRGLLETPRRSAGGIRRFDSRVVDRIRFIRRAQSFGFTLDEIRDLLRMWKSPDSCSAVAQRATNTLDRINSKILALTQMKVALGKYTSACRTRTALDTCPLLTALGGRELPMDHVPRIELVYDRTCPNVVRARDNITGALRDLRVPPVWTEWDRDGDETPRSLQHFCSPTVLVDGLDIGCDETESLDAEGNCRGVYLDDDGNCICGAPSPRLIVDNIHAATTR